MAGREEAVGAEAGGDNRAAGGRERPNGVGEGNTPTDSWTWRKYGQHIKGSPYPQSILQVQYVAPRGCPAKKQMERSRADSAMVVVTYSSEHNHSAKVPSAGQSRQVPKPQPVTPEPAELEAAAVDVHDEFQRFYDGVSVASTSPSEEEGADEMLYGRPMFLDAGVVGTTAPVLLPSEKPIQNF